MPVAEEHFYYTVEEWSNSPLRELLEQLKDINTAYDVGACVGGFGHVLRRYFPDVEIYAFEPAERNFKLLNEEHKYKVAIYYGVKEVELENRGEGNDGGIFLNTIDAGYPRVPIGEKVPAKTLEEMNLPKPDFVKLDVEGAEVNIIEHSTLLKNTPYIILEWHPGGAPPFHQLPKHHVLARADNQYLLCLKSLL